MDYGSKRTGLAHGDLATRTAVPIGTLTFRGLDDLAARIARHCAEAGIATVVLGLPLHPDGAEMRIAQDVHALADRLRARGYAVVLQNESLTSWEAGALAAETNGRAPVDALAATLILRDYMDAARRDG